MQDWLGVGNWDRENLCVEMMSLIKMDMAIQFSQEWRMALLISLRLTSAQQHKRREICGYVRTMYHTYVSCRAE